MATAQELRDLTIFEGLTNSQLMQLASAAHEVPIEPGAVLWHEGDHADQWWVLLDGEVELTRKVGHERVVVSRMRTPGQWAGGFRAWDEAGVYLATGLAVAPGRLLRVSAPVLRALTKAWFPLGGRLIEGLMGTARSIESIEPDERQILAGGVQHLVRTIGVVSGVTPMFFESA